MKESPDGSGGGDPIRAIVTAVPTNPMTYKIVRFKYPNIFKPVRTIERGLTLEQAQAHCSRPDTKGGEGENAWFDGYEEE